MKPRARDLGLPFPGTPGPFNAITDVAGVGVGFATRVADAPAQIRTGVTAIVPRVDHPSLRPVWAGAFALNGNGEMTGTHWIRDAGYFCGPVCITNTHSVGIVHHAAVRWMIQRHRSEFDNVHLWAMPVVAETYDGVLSDILGQHVTEADALEALDSARGGVVAEGNVGGGAGMICYEFKGGTGTSSRVVKLPDRHGTIGVLVQANHGLRDWLTVLGVPVGRELTQDRLFNQEQGSIIVIVATDLPMLPNQLQRVARRAALGVGRGGTPGGNNSGDIFLAFSVANPIDLPQLGAPSWRLEAINDEHFDAIYLAVVQAVEEAVVNALVAAETTPTFRPPGSVARAIDTAALTALVTGTRQPPPETKP